MNCPKCGNIFYLFLIIFIVLCPNILRGQGLVYVGNTSDGSILYYDKNIKRVSDNIKVWSTIIPSKEFRKLRIQEMKRTGIPTTVYNQFNKTTSLLEINCVHKKFRSLLFIDYGESGNILYRYDTPSDFSDIETGTIFDSLYLKVCLPVSPVIDSSDWLKYNRSKDGLIWLYNKVSIKHQTKNIVQVGVKTVHSDESREGYVQNLTKHKFPTEGYDKLSYQLSLNEIDCRKRRFRILSMTEYDTDGNTLFSRNNENKEWDYIHPHSIWESLLEKVCK